MPQDQFAGFPKRGMEPSLWHPRINQLSTNAFDPKSAIALRKPFTDGQYAVIGQWVVASFEIVFDAGGSGNNLIWLELPVAYQSMAGSTPPGQIIGSFYVERTSGPMWVGAITTTTGVPSTAAIFRTGGGVTANGFGLGALWTITAGDSFSVQLTYFANV